MPPKNKGKGKTIKEDNNSQKEKKGGTAVKVLNIEIAFCLVNFTLSLPAMFMS